MGAAKIEVAVGSLSFKGEGDEAWLTSQLDKVFEAAAKLNAHITQREQTPKGADTPAGTAQDPGSLAAFLKAKSIGDNQVKRFIDTDCWLRLKKKELSTAAVSKALAENHQSKLSNPADCLNKNVSKGFCVKEQGTTFYITPEGLASMNES